MAPSKNSAVQTRAGGARGVNYTTQEKSILIDIISKYREVIENKRTDSATKLLKSKVWHQVAKEFNYKFVNKREPISLKICYYNLKRQSRKRARSEKLRGDSHYRLLDDLDLKVLKVAGQYDGLSDCNADSEESLQITSVTSLKPGENFSEDESLYNYDEPVSSPDSDQFYIDCDKQENISESNAEGANSIEFKEEEEDARKPTVEKTGSCSMTTAKEEYYRTMTKFANEEHEKKMQLLDAKLAFYKKLSENNFIVNKMF